MKFNYARTYCPLWNPLRRFKAGVKLGLVFETQASKLSIPSFSGSSEEWLPFKNTFVFILPNNPDLSGIIKFSYLLDRVDSETNAFLGGVRLSIEGYERA